MTDTQKLHLPSQAMSLLCWALFCAGACSAVLQIHQAGGQSHRPLLLPYCSAALLSAQLGWIWLSLAPVGWAPFSWTEGHPHQTIPCWDCHPTPTDLCFSALLSAPLTALWRKVQWDLQASRGTRSTGANPNTATATDRRRQSGTGSGGRLIFFLRPRPQWWRAEEKPP